MTVKTRTLEERSTIRAVLLQDAIANAYQLGDLDEPYFKLCRWYAAGPEDAPEAVVLLYTGLSVPVLLTHGQTPAVGACLKRFAAELPGRMIAHLRNDHLEEVLKFYRASGAGHHADMRMMTRMGLTARQLQPATPTYTVETLAMRDTGDIIDLYQYYPDNFFEPAQLATGHYYGVRQQGRLVAVAGVHVFAPSSGVACLGNIVTHPEFRGRGLSTACTSHLCQQLVAQGVEVLALNVDQHNTAATRVYEKLGFRHNNTYLEGMLHALSGIAS